MATQWLRRTWLAAVGASVLLLAACGGGKTESELAPSRIVVFGDAMADIGQNANGSRYTVNDGSVNNWTLYVSDAFGLPLAPARSGGTSYAEGNSRVALTPGAGGDAGARTLAAQVDAFLAAQAIGPNDLILLNTGHSDIIVQARAAIEGGQTADAARDAMAEAGKALARQARRLVDAGARHVVVAGAYNLGRSPWAKQTDRESLLEALSLRFNDAFKVEVADLGESLLYIDFANQVNLYEGRPANYSFSNVERPVCNSVDAGEGIGTGAGQVDSSECGTGTLVDGNYRAYLFADRVYLTPPAHRLLGEFAVDRMRQRW